MMEAKNAEVEAEYQREVNFLKLGQKEIKKSIKVGASSFLYSKTLTNAWNSLSSAK